MTAVDDQQVGDSAEGAVGPLVDDDAEVAEGLDGGFDVAADGGTVGRGSVVRLFDGDYAAVGPGVCRHGVERGGQVAQANGEVLRRAPTGRSMPPAPRSVGFASARVTWRVAMFCCTVR